MTFASRRNRKQRGFPCKQKIYRARSLEATFHIAVCCSHTIAHFSNGFKGTLRCTPLNPEPYIIESSPSSFWERSAGRQIKKGEFMWIDKFCGGCINLHIWFPFCSSQPCALHIAVEEKKLCADLRNVTARNRSRLGTPKANEPQILVVNCAINSARAREGECVTSASRASGDKIPYTPTRPVYFSSALINQRTILRSASVRKPYEWNRLLLSPGVRSFSRERLTPIHDSDDNEINCTVEIEVRALIMN